MSDTEKTDRILVVMAHPDDAEILVGGTLCHLKDAGRQIGIATMTGGDAGSVTHTKAEIARIRLEEARKAAAKLDASYTCIGLMDLEIFANAVNLRKVVEVLRIFRPTVVITHSPEDYLLDHEQTSQLVRSAAFAAAAPLYETRQVPPAEAPDRTPALYYADPIEGVNALGKRVPPDVYIDISDQIDRKAALLACHESQREWLRRHHQIDEYLERMRDWAARYGQECGVTYAEGLRQHLGHAYPRDPVLQNTLSEFVRPAD